MKKLMYFLLSAILVFSFVGCNKGTTSDTISNDKKVLTSEGEKKEDKEENKEVKEEKSEEKKEESISKAYLYFSDDQAMYLNKEEVKLDKITADVLIEKLKEGPKQKDNHSVMPKDLDIKVKVEGKTAYVDLPKDVSKKLNVGSAGEGMFVYSIVNTLTLNKDLGIEQVKFLIEGKDSESISGHMDTSEPIKANNELIKH